MRGFERLLVDDIQYLFKNPVDILQDIVIPEAQHEIADRFEIPGPKRIFRLLFSMLPTIKLDDKFCIRTTEIDNESIQRHLTTELPSAKPSVPQTKPKNAFGIGLMPSQATRGSDR